MSIVTSELWPASAVEQCALPPDATQASAEGIVVYQDELMTVVGGNIPLPHRPGQTVPYYISHPRDPAYFQGYVHWEKGYGNGHEDKLPLHHAFGRYGYGMLAVGQNRWGMLRDPTTGNPDAIKSLACNSLAVVEALGFGDKTLHTAGYSAGGLVTANMVQLAKRRGLSCYDRATVVLEAASGTLDDENALRLTARGLDELARTSTPDDLPPVALAETVPTVNGLVAVAGVMLRNPAQAVREYGEISSRDIYLLRLAEHVGWLSLFGFGEDLLAPTRKIDPKVEQLFAGIDQKSPSLPPSVPHNVSYAMPYSCELGADGKPIGVRGANHMGPFTFPERVVDATVEQIRQGNDYLQTVS